MASKNVLSKWHHSHLPDSTFKGLRVQGTAGCMSQCLSLQRWEDCASTAQEEASGVTSGPPKRGELGARETQLIWGGPRPEHCSASLPMASQVLCSNNTLWNVALLSGGHSSRWWQLELWRKWLGKFRMSVFVGSLEQSLTRQWSTQARSQHWHKEREEKPALLWVLTCRLQS